MEQKNFYQLFIGALLLSLLLLAPVQAAGKKKAKQIQRPWWDNYPLIAQTDKLDLAKQLNVEVGFVTGQTDPSWGLYAQKLYEQPQNMKAFHDAGLKAICYYETFGSAVSFITEMDKPKKGMKYNPIKTWHWSWDQYHGGPIHWVGPQSYFDCEEVAGIYTRKHPRYGGQAMTYPDGRVATGYLDNDPSDPRKSCVLDAGKSKDLFGVNHPECEHNDKVNAIDPKTGKPKGPLKGLIYAYNSDAAQWGYAGHFGIQKDAACPMWIDLQRASVLYGADHGLDGMWTDNFSPWDSLGYPATEKAFGDWSVAGFRPYLAEHFNAERLKAMGVQDARTFDIRAALRAKAKEWGGDDKNLYAPLWNDPRWMNEPLWRAYLIYKRQTVSKALSAYYKATKEAARKAGKPDFLVAGNDTPYFSLGCPRGDLDMVSVETTPAWHMGTSARGVMLPPAGRFSPIIKLAREHAKSRFVNVWMYMKQQYQVYHNNPGILSVLFYDMLANHAMPMLLPDLDYAANNPQASAAFFKFVKSVKPTLGGRLPVEDVAIYYSSSSILMTLTPNGFVDMDHQGHQFGLYGWGTALGELHHQYRVIPEWKLTSPTLAAFRVLIIPDAEVFEPAAVRNVIEPWVKGGGLLIVTGNSGYRLGEPDNFEPNPQGFALSGLTNASSLNGAPPIRSLQDIGKGRVLYIKENIGMQYYVAERARKDLLSLFKEAMDDVLKDRAPLNLQAVKDVANTVGLTLYKDDETKRFFVDVNNLNIDLAKDTVQQTPTLKFDVQLPEWLRETEKHAIHARVLSPDGSPTAEARLIAPDRAEITLSPIQYYASVILE